MDPQIDNINAQTLRNFNRKQQAKRVKTYKIVLEMCYKRLKQFVKNFPNEQQFTFNVPAFLPDRPLFNHKECITYVIQKLEKAKCQVYYQPPSTVIIDWSEKPSKYTQQEKYDKFLEKRIRVTDKNYK